MAHNGFIKQGDINGAYGRHGETTVKGRWKMDKEYDFSKGKRYSVELALRLNKIVHDLCKDVPYDIGIKLAEEVTAFRMDSDRMDSTMYRIKTGDHYLKDF